MATLSTYGIIIYDSKSPEESARAALSKKLYGSEGYCPRSIPLDFHPTMNTLILGSHHSIESVQRVAKECTDAALECAVYFYSSDEVEKYGYAVRAIIDLFSKEELSMYPWLKRVARRTSPSDDALYDEDFIRGLKSMIGEELHPNSILSYCFSELIEGKVSEADLIERGLHAEMIHDAIGVLVARKSKEITMNGHKARILFGMDDSTNMYIKEVVKKVAKGFDIGINMRYNLSTSTTLLTFFTHDPNKVDLSFVDKPPYNGDGRPWCKDASFPGVTLPPPDKDLSEIFQ